jgi:hypothetical protein
MEISDRLIQKTMQAFRRVVRIARRASRCGYSPSWGE